MENETSKNSEDLEENENEIDPISDIIDYLVRSAKISFKASRIAEAEVRTSDKIQIASDIYKRSPTDFLMRYGKYLAPYHIGYFEKLQPPIEEVNSYRQCVSHLKKFHSDDIRHKRIRNRRYKALQKLQNETDYFSEKQMMFRNPLLYEQLVGQYLTDDEIKKRDHVDSENLTFLNVILETVDRNDMRERKNEQMIEEDLENSEMSSNKECYTAKESKNKKHWGDFETPDPTPSFTPETRKQAMITAPERNLLRDEFLQEMFSSFIEGRDADIDYDSIDNDEQYDDLQQVSQDEEDKYFDSETNDVDNLEEHMTLVEEYGRKNSSASIDKDPLDVFMEHIKNKT